MPINRDYTRLVRTFSLKQEFVSPHCAQWKGMAERVIRTLKEQRLHRHRFTSQVHAARVIADWIATLNA
ncbi:integrase core domain-containing protein [Stenotrophomonas maltophilia]|uniref:integrase core domain-containing protein n=1 Tax=Stenotrophomonas maltophilia TaxID=40324 RepID=UPI000A850339|nr:integrase core domain-containing protein [Stenotrophomonas maltophilia]MBH1383587.1 transposase [Stenotrophomonas maltophilia]MBN5103634.1 transposase [Stenotrophomonas maltophilia]MCF3461040.1 transposase [Stenotrophomonas maltophilia]MCF3517952.1 transposase [Stenotrophomonas maltophilia]MCM2519437.1 integrase core domain-containing protein [Stenotrophomonas maltophilia]